MNTFIVILRGINVSGKHKLPMLELRELLATLGFTEVKTYIQSGNIVLMSTESKAIIARKIKEGIQDKFRYEVPVIVKTIEEWEIIVENNPYKDAEPKQQYFTFLAEKPKVSHFEIDAKQDEFSVVNDMVYMRVESAGTSKLSNNLFEKKLKVIATTRNLRTTLKLLVLAKDLTSFKNL